MESAIVNGDSIYSISCKEVKKIPSIIVINNLIFLSLKLFCKIEWWVHVTVNPDEIKIIVFNRGISKGLNGLIPKGGQSWPISNEGAKEEWKYAQKNDKKKKISEIMKRIMPKRILMYTKNVWKPWNVDSRITSRHHWILINIVHKKLKVTHEKSSHSLNQFTVEIKRFISSKEINKGQGLWVTKWKGWLYFVINLSSIESWKNRKNIGLNNRYW